MYSQLIVYHDVSNRPETLGIVGDNQLLVRILAMTAGRIGSRRRFEVKGRIKWMDLDLAENTERKASPSST